MRVAKGIGVFKVTVTRIDGETHTGYHELDVAAGNWITALETAAVSSEEFSYIRES
jgi:hypothetical protein